MRQLTADLDSELSRLFLLRPTHEVSIPEAEPKDLLFQRGKQLLRYAQHDNS